jgi:hypothetical protein
MRILADTIEMMISAQAQFVARRDIGKDAQAYLLSLLLRGVSVGFAAG